MKNLIDKLPFQIPEINDKTKYYFLAGAVIILLLLDYFLLVRPQFKAFGALGQNIATLDKNIKETNYNLERIALFKAEAQKLEKNLGKLEKSILSHEEAPSALDKISRIATSVDVQVDQIMPLKESEAVVLESAEGKYYALPIFIKAEGGYHNIGRFLNKFETDEIFMKTEDFEIIRNPLNTKKHILKMAVTIFTLERAEE